MAAECRFVRTGCGIAALLLSFVARVSVALTVEEIDMQYRDGAYELNLTATLAAPVERVEAVIRDYASYPQLDGRILEANVLERPSANIALLYTRLRACFGPFCRNVKRVEQVEERRHELISTALADRSDVVRSTTHTILVAESERTRLRYATSIVPKFWIPAVIGRSLMLRTLRDATIDLFEHVELRAAAPAAPEPVVP